MELRKRDKTMDKLLASIGLIGAILIVVGFFAPWISVSVDGSSTLDLPIMGPKSISFSASGFEVSGWDAARGREFKVSANVFLLSWERTLTFEGDNRAYIGLAAGIIALVGAIGILINPSHPRSRYLLAMLAIGGILAVIGAGWVFSNAKSLAEEKIESMAEKYPEISNVSVNVGYRLGPYLTAIGGALCLIGAYDIRKHLSSYSPFL